MVTDLPEGWVLEELGQISQVIMGQSPSSDTYNSDGVGLPFFQGKAEFTELHPIVKKWCSNPNKIAEANDILLSVRAPVGSTNIANQRCCIGRGLAAVRYPNFKYIFYYLRLNEKELDKKGTGTTFRAISGETVRTLRIPIPSAEEEVQIVEKIEELFSELDKGIENLKTAQQQLKVYRQAVLKWAFEGKLTNENVKDGELPAGWELETLGNVSESCLGKMLDTGKNKGTPAPYLRNINVRWNAFNLEDLFEMPFESKETERYSLKDGDLVICEGGEPGRAAIWKSQMPGMKIQKALHRVRFNKNVVPVFFLYYLNWIASTKKIDQYFTGTTIKHLTGQSLKKLIFPLPPVEEQKKIILEIESRLSICDKMEETISASLLQAETLRQSILKRAFEGKLLKN